MCFVQLPMPSSIVDTVTSSTTVPDSDIVACFRLPKPDSENTITPVTKKQKTNGGGSSTVKAVKTVDPAVIAQRRDAVIKRILVLRSKLVKDRALLAKYTVPCSSESNTEKQAIDDTGDENGDESSSNEK